MQKISLAVNGKRHTMEVADSTLLVTLLRDQLGLTGTHVGCDTSQCGACTVHVDGRSIKSCTMLAAEADGTDVTTIEGLERDGHLHPMQTAFRAHHGLQCGFCTPGMIMAASAFAAEHPDAGEAEVRRALEGNLCRCTGYQGIVAAVVAGSKAMHGRGEGTS